MGERVSSISNGYSTVGRQKRISPNRLIVIQQGWGDARDDGGASRSAEDAGVSVPRAEGLT